MTVERDDHGEVDPLDCIDVFYTPGNHRVIEPGPILFTADELREAIRSSGGKLIGAGEEGALIGELTRPGGFWNEDVVLLVALLSADHARRAAQYLHMAPKMLAERTSALRDRLAIS